MDGERQAIEALIGRYHDALHRGDVTLLATVFHPQAHYATASDGTLLQMDMPSYLPVVAARRSPQAGGEARWFRIDAIERIGPVTASVRVRSRMLGKHFDDLLSLIRIDGRWQIIAKVFHVQPDASSKEDH